MQHLAGGIGDPASRHFRRTRVAFEAAASLSAPWTTLQCDQSVHSHAVGRSRSREDCGGPMESPQSVLAEKGYALRVVSGSGASCHVRDHWRLSS